MNEQYFCFDDIEKENVGKGIDRSILAHAEKLMLVEVAFQKDSIGAKHQHPHEQLAYVVSGEFDYIIGEETYRLKEKDSVYVEPDIEHGCVCIKDGVLLDIFTPGREDFLK